jgi:signal transduction histidine kinase
MLGRALRQVVRFLWHGPSGLDRAARLEWRFVTVRWLAVVCLSPVILMARLPREQATNGFVVLAVASAYNLALMQGLTRRPSMFARSYTSMVGDGMLVSALVVVAGGFDTSFSFLTTTAAAASAMRYGPAPAMAIVVMFVGVDALEAWPQIQTLSASFAIRTTFLVFTALLVGSLGVEVRVAEAARQERLRQANLLNDVTADLGSSLELEPVLQASVEAAARLLGGTTAVLRPAPSLVDDSVSRVTMPPIPTVLGTPAGVWTTQHGELDRLCVDILEQPPGATPWEPLHVCLTQQSGSRAVAFALSLPTRQVRLGALAVALPANQKVPTLDPDILASFVDRMTLALENASLYRAVATRTHDLQRAYTDLAIAHQELLSVDEMKTDFVASVSHEFRTPLSSISAFSELLMTYDDPAVQREFLHIINSEAERLTRLVDDVLDIAKIESGHMDWQMALLSVAELVQENVRTFAPLAAKNGIEFRCSAEQDLPPVFGDRDRLREVISNLLNNALKFTPGGRITLEAQRDGGVIIVSVTDTGIGIDPADQERIFEKFQQVGPVLTGKPRGTGLGLAICREIVAHHGGQLWVRSALGAGSTFSFCLPVAAEDGPTLAGGAGGASRNGKDGSVAKSFTGNGSTTGWVGAVPVEAT